MISFQLLGCQVEIETASRELESLLAYAATVAEQPLEPKKLLRFEVRGDGPFEILRAGDLCDSAPSAGDALFILYQRAYCQAIERLALAGWIVFHGVTTTVAGCRLLILGAKHAGKSTLAAALLSAGHEVEGDELALFSGGEVIAFPRCLQLKKGSDEVVPGLGAILAGQPRMGSGDEVVWSVPPRRIGSQWRLKRAPIDRLVSITPNHGGKSSLEPAPPHHLIENLLRNSFRWGETRKSLLAAASFLGASGGWRLTLGRIDEAIASLENASRSHSSRG